MPPAASAQPQTSIYETTIDNPDLEAALEEREDARQTASKARADFNTLSEKVKALVAITDIADAPVRVGRFVISRRNIAAKSVSFETEATTRLQISLLSE